MSDKLAEIKSYRDTFDPWGDSRWPEDYTDYLIAEVERLRAALQVHHDLGLWSLGHDVCPECHEPLARQPR